MKKVASFALFMALAFVLATAPAYAAPNPDTAELETLLNQPEGVATEATDVPMLALTAPEAANRQPPLCPTAVPCTSTTGICAIGLNCTTVNLGPCCIPASGPPGICCINGTIRVRTCPCAGVGCPSQQVTVRYCV